MRWLRIPAVMLLTVTLSGCGLGIFSSVPAYNVAPVLIATGESLDLVKGQFVTIGTVMNGLLDRKSITDAQYNPWRTFVPQFQKSYPLAVKTWQTAKHVCAPPPPAVLDEASCTTQAKLSSAQVTALGNELTALAGQAYVYVSKSGATPALAR